MNIVRALNRRAAFSIVPRHAAPLQRRNCTAYAGEIRKVTGEELEVALANREKPMIVDFYADWCGPCVLLAKELEQVAQELGDSVQILKVDTEIEKALASQLRIQGLPTMIFIGMDPEKPALRTEGLLPANSIKDIVLNELMEPAAPAESGA
uniref:Thioredoxin n=1 Tax=Ulva fasciata TaxID=111617 RepID=D0PNI8_9CHLO|nr:thioredoxin [Ulva fasciata]